MTDQGEWKRKRTPGNAPGVIIAPDGKEFMVYGADEVLARIRALEARLAAAEEALRDLYTLNYRRKARAYFDALTPKQEGSKSDDLH
jgi:hypothetical protein